MTLAPQCRATAPCLLRSLARTFAVARTSPPSLFVPAACGSSAGPARVGNPYSPAHRSECARARRRVVTASGIVPVACFSRALVGCSGYNWRDYTDSHDPQRSSLCWMSGKRRRDSDTGFVNR